MLLSEKIRVALFVAAIITVYCAAAWLLLKLLLRRWFPGNPPRRGETWLRLFFLALAAAGLLCFLYGWMVEPFWLEVTRVHISSPKLAGALRPIRIVHISDLHSEKRPRLEERLPQVIAAERPDLIVFTGDSLNSLDGLPVFRRLIEDLARIAPVFLVRGNWDARYTDQLDTGGIERARWLDGEGRLLEIAGARLWVSGVAHGAERRIDQALEGAAGAFTVFLYHTPDEIETASARDVDLYCAGHTHGGQVALPWYGALMTLSKYDKRYEAGLYRSGKTWLYVNRGIGMEGGLAPRVRFCARPEVTVIQVGPEMLPGSPGEER
jgi:predicted MPP superfamily phosphohydrolase